VKTGTDIAFRLLPPLALSSTFPNAVQRTRGYTHLEYNMSSTFSKEDVQSHNKADNLWIIVDEDVYDLTKFQVTKTRLDPGMTFS